MLLSLVCCTVRSVEEYRDGEAPEQEIFQNSEGQCWDNCTVSALFPAEVSFLTRQCTASFFKAEGLDDGSCWYTAVLRHAT